MMYSVLKTKLALAVSLLFVLASCQKKEDPQTEQKYPTPYELQVPKGFPNPQLSANNPLTVEGILLGKMLYGDSILSTNGRSCTSCHQPINSFSSPLYKSWGGITFSIPPHINLAFKNLYNWDGSQGSLDTLALGDFVPEFFNPNPTLLFQRISSHPVYPDLFKKAWGVNDIYTLSYDELKRKIAMSIAQYLRTKISAGSKFDLYRNKKALLTPDEYEGYIIFFTEKGDCFHCHSEPLFSDQLLHNNGVSNTYIGFDAGRQQITGMDADLGKFVTPTLRNIELTAPYMHDGRFKTLQEVVDFYDQGVQDNAHVDPLMTKTNGTRQLNLTPLQKMQLIAFLKTLTDLDYLEY